MKREVTKVVFNDGERGPRLSREATSWMKQHGYSGKFHDYFGRLIVPRHHPVLVACIETLGDAASDGCKLRVTEIEGNRYYLVPDDTIREWVIEEKDLILAKRKEGNPFVDYFDPEKVFFTADTHFGNRKLFHYCKRPFEDAGLMEEELIRRWNETVPEDGIVFHLGDFAHGSASHWNEVLGRLNGAIHLVVGNHDSSTAKLKGLENFASVREQRLIDVGGQKIYLNHYPFLCYAGSYNGVWQLYGHVHSGPHSNSGLDHPRLRKLFPLQYDVGVDNNDYRPVPFAMVKEKIDSRVQMAGGTNES